MGFRLKGFLMVVLISLTTFTYLIYHTVTSNKVQAIPPEAEKGKKVFQKRACVECHTIFGNGGYAGGDLTKIYGKLGNAALKDYLTHPPLLTGAKRKRHEKLTAAEANDLIAYFEFLNSVDTANWPPRPIYGDKDNSQ